MKPLEIKGARTRLGYSQKYMGDQLGIAEKNYGLKERGEVRFTSQEIVTVSRVLGFTFDQVNDFFFDGGLPAR